MVKQYFHIIILAVAGIISAWFIGNGFKRKPHGEYISVTGMAEVNFLSDNIQWSGDYSQSNMELKAAYQAIKSDKEKVLRFFQAKGVQDSEMVFGTINIEKLFDNIREDDNYRSVFKGYKASQSIKIKSRRVDIIESIARESMDLISKAAADARARAEKIAKASDCSLGSLKSSDLGVFQITGEGNDEEYSWGGVFNTSSKRKTARVTVSSSYSAN